MDNLLLFINTLLLILLFSIFIYTIIKYNDLNHQVSHLEYNIFKPLFPFELKTTDPLKISMYHKKFINQETPYLNTSSTARFI